MPIRRWFGIIAIAAIIFGIVRVVPVEAYYPWAQIFFGYREHTSGSDNVLVILLSAMIWMVSLTTFVACIVIVALAIFGIVCAFFRWSFS